MWRVFLARLDCGGVQSQSLTHRHWLCVQFPPVASLLRLLAATVASGFSLCFFVAALSPALAEEQAIWRPAPTERLVKLPGAYLKKAIERDFSESGLADAIGDRDARIALKAKTLADLRDAVNEAEGEVRTELRHQFLAEKREYVKLLGERQELQRKQLRTKIRVYERILRGLERKAPANEATQQLLKKQERTGKTLLITFMQKKELRRFGRS